MSLTTYSGFIYGHNITDENSYINFSEDGGLTELSVAVEIGSYSITNFLGAVLTALNSEGDNVYTGSLDRATGLITIDSDANFDLIVTNGAQSSISCFDLLGFDTDRSGSDSYTGDKRSGALYEPQYWLQSYVDFEDNVSSVSSAVSTSASGVVEVINYGKVKMMECNIKYITDITNQHAIKNNPNGVNDLRTFLNYIMNKYTIEFMKDLENPGDFTTCILESTTKDKKGTSARLYELYNQKLANYWETKLLTFRSID